MTDKLIEKIRQTNNPSCIGLDTAFDYLPELLQKQSCNSLKDVSSAITEFNYEIIEKIYKIAPAVKIQVAYYEMYGYEGMKAFSDTIEAAKKRGLIVISDVKRNDIGSTAGCYSSAYLGQTKVLDKTFTPFESDYITVNGYLGADGIKPFTDDCKKFGKGIFVLVKTSNPSSGQLQDKTFSDGRTLYETMGALVEEWGVETRGKYGFSSVGAVVGATHPAQAEILRKQMPHTLFLIPGYGAQGATAEDLTVCFNEKGLGGIVNNSRGILCAYKTEKYKGLSYAQAAYEAAVNMQSDLYTALKKAGKA